jgi:hypothetical protein
MDTAARPNSGEVDLIEWHEAKTLPATRQRKTTVPRPKLVEGTLGRSVGTMRSI